MIGTEQIFNEITSKVSKVAGIDYIYFLNKDYSLIKAQKIKGTDKHIDQILNIIKLESLFEKIATNFYSKPFHTYTLLNENGLMVISKLPGLDLYMIVIAGENEPVDLINLLKICKETRTSNVL